MSTVQLTEDQTYVFKATDFASANFAGVQITSLPTTGTLYLSGVPVTLNQIIRAADVSAGNFTFVPNTDVTTAGSFSDVVGTTSSTGTLIKTNSSMTHLGRQRPSPQRSGSCFGAFWAPRHQTSACAP
jgi:hypothetical protein